MKACIRVEVSLHSFLSTALCEGAWSALRLRRFIPEKNFNASYLVMLNTVLSLYLGTEVKLALFLDLRL
jgi:hypothetical protein